MTISVVIEPGELIFMSLLILVLNLISGLAPGASAGSGTDVLEFGKGRARAHRLMLECGPLILMSMSDVGILV
ncbi:hypothetical protein B0H13DRAFT_2350349 [Mycena leptocephala]|nr:hypothetical protein B0H13DRAFT_2350349 [Mycena leptocephala]